MLSMLAAAEDIVFVAIVFGSKAIFGVISAVVANNRGRSAVGWFFIGLALDCIGLVLVLALPDLKKEEEKERRRRLENRRLREQLAKERQVSDSRNTNVERRLGAHDEALGLDTSNPPELPTPAATPQLTEGAAWFYARDNERQGPVTAETVRHLLQAGAIDGDTLIWSEGMQDWTALKATDAFAGDVS
ncbi:MAG: DUF4339 domain-containing protein [Planctomycetota bacterium]